MMIKQLYLLVTLQLKEFFREPAILFWAFLFPLAMAGVLGVAFNQDQEQIIKIGLIKNSKNSLLEPQKKTSSLQFIVMDKSDAITNIKKGMINLFIESKPNNSLVFYFDPNNPNSKKEYYQVLHFLSSHHSKQYYTTSENHLKNTGSRYIDYLIPGLLSMGIMNSCLWGIGWSLIEMRMKKLLRRLIIAPIVPFIFFLSFFVTRLIITSSESIILYYFAKFFFHIEMEGSISALIFIYLSGLFGFTGVGILTGSRAKNSHIGNGLMNAVTMPMMILSGIFFSYKNFPDFILPIIQYLPLTLLADTIRSIFLEGYTLQNVIFPSSILIILGGILLLISTKLFKWH